jgi:hypothetical protein
MFQNPTFHSWFRRVLTCVSHGSNEFYSVAAQTEPRGATGEAVDG